MIFLSANIIYAGGCTHSRAESVKDYRTESASQNGGCTQRYYNNFTCSDCGYTWSEATSETFHVDHVYLQVCYHCGLMATTKPTTDGEGETTTGSTGSTGDTPSHNHYYTVEIAATCTSQGKNSCSCGDSYTRSALGHQSLTTTKQPTCTESGSAYCGRVVGSWTCPYTESIPALGHNWGAPYTYYSKTTHYETCSRCNITRLRNHTFEVTYNNCVYMDGNIHNRPCQYCGQVTFNHNWVLNPDDYTETQHSKTCTSTNSSITCCNVTEWFNHNYKYTKTTGTENEYIKHITECTDCNLPQYLEDHVDADNDHYCDKCGQLLRMILITDGSIANTLGSSDMTAHVEFTESECPHMAYAL